MRVLVERVATNASPTVGPKRARTAKGPLKKAGPTAISAADAADTELAGECWRVLESGVLATPTSTEVVTEHGRRRVWCDPRGNGRLVCEHGWGAYHISGWNGPRAHLFSKPEWTTCDCRSTTGLCGGRVVGKRMRGKEESTNDSGESGGEQSDSTVVMCPQPKVKPPGYYETLVAQHGTEELRPGLKGARVPGVYGVDGGAFFMVKGDASSVLRCRHGHTTHTLAAQARDRRRRAASLVATAVSARSSKRVLVLLLLLLHATREARRVRRGGTAPCGCGPAHVKACVLACGR